MEGFLIHVRNRLQLRIEYGTYCKIEGNTQLLQIDLADWRYKASLILVALCTCWLHVLRIQWKKHGCRWLEAVWVRQITGCWQIDSVDCIISENWLDSLLRSSSIISSLVCCNLEVECNAVVYLIWMADDSHLSAGDFNTMERIIISEEFLLQMEGQFSQKSLYIQFGSFLLALGAQESMD